MKRLIEAKHGYDSRGSAILYIDGEVMEGDNHPEMISEYLSQRKDYALEIIKKYCEAKGFDEDKTQKALDDFEANNELPYAIYKDFAEWDRAENGDNTSLKKLEDITLAFAHVDAPSIYIETSSLVNVDIHTVALAIKSEYPQYEIFDDDTELEDGSYKKLAKNLFRKEKGRLIKKSDSDNLLVSPVPKAYFNNNYFTDFRQQQPKQDKKKVQKEKGKSFKDHLKEQMDMFNLLNG